MLEVTFFAQRPPDPCLAPSGWQHPSYFLIRFNLFSSTRGLLMLMYCSRSAFASSIFEKSLLSSSRYKWAWLGLWTSLRISIRKLFRFSRNSLRNLSSPSPAFLFLKPFLVRLTSGCELWLGIVNSRFNTNNTPFLSRMVSQLCLTNITYHNWLQVMKSFSICEKNAWKPCSIWTVSISRKLCKGSRLLEWP